MLSFGVPMTVVAYRIPYARAVGVDAVKLDGAPLHPPNNVFLVESANMAWLLLSVNHNVKPPHSWVVMHNPEPLRRVSANQLHHNFPHQVNWRAIIV